jgi:hypothetical protein
VRVGLAILVVACALFVFAVVRVLAFGSEATEQERQPLDEVATPDFCPRYEPTVLPPGFTPRKRETRNLGNGTMGRSYTYGDGVHAVEIHVGFEALDIYEDLDFVEHEVVVDDIPRTVHVPRAINSGFIGVAWDEPDESPPCAQLTLLGRRLDEQTILDIAAGVRRVDS